MMSKQHIKSRGTYNEKYDSFFDPEEDKWLEPKCNDPNCEFCKDRPTKPSECKK